MCPFIITCVLLLLKETIKGSPCHASMQVSLVGLIGRHSMRKPPVGREWGRRDDLSRDYVSCPVHMRPWCGIALLGVT